MRNDVTPSVIGFKRRGRLAVAALLAAVALGGCSMPLSEFGSTDASTARDSDGFLAVNALPAGREEKAMEPSERSKLEGELIAAREKQTAAAAAAVAAGSITANAAPPAAK